MPFVRLSRPVPMQAALADPESWPAAGVRVNVSVVDVSVRERTLRTMCVAAGTGRLPIFIPAIISTKGS